MADIIEFKAALDNAERAAVQSNLKPVLGVFLKELANIEELMIVFKTKEGEIHLAHSGLGVRDKSYILQILQRDIFEDFGPTEELEEDDL